MRQLRLLGIALMAIFALGVVLAGTASATEAGLLYLPKEGPPFTFSVEGGPGELVTKNGGVTIKCTLVTGTGESKEEKHVTLGTGTLDFTGCKQIKGESKTACNSKGDPSGTILVPIDWHLFNALEGKEGKTLQPGIGVLPLYNNAGKTTFEFLCASETTHIEVKGWDLGLVLTSTLTADIEKAEVHFFSEGENCDKGDKWCENAQATEPFLANLAGTFEKGELIQLANITWKPMMLVDD